MAEHTGKKIRGMDKRLGALRSDLESLEQDMKTVAGDAEGIADSRVHLALRKAEDVAHNAYRLAEETATDVVHDVDKWACGNLASARKTVRDRPLSALALTMGAGALIGAILSRR